MSRLSSVIIIFCIGGFQLVTSQYLFAGDACTLKNSSRGVCRVIAKCPVIQQAMQQGNRNPSSQPVICSFQGRDPIVCCPVSQQGSTTTRHTPPSTTTRSFPVRTNRPATPTPSSITNNRPGLPFSSTIEGSSISERKCHEYAKYVYQLVEAPTLTDEVNYVNRSTCAAVEVPLVVGGEPVKLNEYPHMALLGYGPESNPAWLCGGSLISEQYVLTAAHCLSSREEGDVRVVRLGEYVISDPNDGALTQTIPVVQRIAHPEYRPPARYNDIALLRLQRTATFTGSVRPACLHRLRELPNNGSDIQFIATGWGRIGYSDGTSDTLLKVLLYPIAHPECNRTYRNEATTSKLRRGIDDESMICAGEPNGGKDTCQGDSGGPLQYLRASPYCTYNVVGVTSFGKFCGFQRTPAVYTRIYYYMDWIEQIVWPNN